MEVKMREALDLSGGDISGLFDEGLAIFIYVLVALAIVIPIVLGRLRKRQDVPEEAMVR
jgi:putative tricarboxylic transport membrane protein